MLHPVGVDALQQIDALHLAHGLRTHQLLVFLIELGGSFLQFLDEIFLIGSLELVLGKAELVIIIDQPAAVQLVETGQVPVLLIHIVGAEHVDIVLDGIIHHLHNGIVHILAVEHLIALTVDDLTLTVHNVIVVKDGFTDRKVAALDLLLGALHDVGEHLALDRLILLDVHAVEDHTHPLAAEDTHQVVLAGEEELALTRVALTAGTSAQLVVDTAALVALRTDDV